MVLSSTVGTSAKNQRGTQMESVVNDYISREIVQDRALLPLSNETSLMEAGILDSLSLLRLVVFLDEQFKITVDEVDVVPENFDSVNAICAYLRAREPRTIEDSRAQPAGRGTGWSSR
jgi:acyl carrier protein